MKKVLKSILKKTPLYPFCRDIARRRRIKKFWNFDENDHLRLTFYKQFVNQGDLVFDVGANEGNRAKLFYEIGAKIVAVEPQSGCADFLQEVFRGVSGFHLERKALGASVGNAEMRISDSEVLSSLSDDWIRTVKESGRFSHRNWNRTEIVEVDTIDNLISKFGSPSFIKIDVEGFEAQVMAGLSSAIKGLSMEFIPEYPEGTMRCVKRLCQLGEYEFQISLGESMDFALPSWVNGGQIEEEFTKIPLTDFGDIYARLVGENSAI